MKSYFRIIGIMLFLCILLQPCMAESSTTKAVVVDLSFHNGNVTMIQSRVLYNYPPDNIAHKNILIQLKDGQGTVLDEKGIDDPRIAYLEDGVTYLNDVNFSVIVPYKKDLAKIDLYNGTSQEQLISVDTKDTIRVFCNDNRADPDCTNVPAASTQAKNSIPVNTATILFAIGLAGSAFVGLRKT